jgi:Flagellar basal body-associated protein FliL
MATQQDTKPRQDGLKKFILASVGVSLMGLILGFFIAIALFPADTPAPVEKVGSLVEKPVDEGGHRTSQEEAVAIGSVADEVPHGPVSIVKLEPIVTNLSDTADVWVRLEASMLFDGEAVENKDVLAAKLSQHVLAYLRTLKLTDLQGSGAVNAIVQDLNEITTTISDGQAQGVLISGLVFE